MDFLDPRKRRAHDIRLITGYILVAIAISLGGWILLNAASGIGVDTKTGQIIQNSLLFVDSRPGGARIFLNDQLQGPTTSARLVIPAGAYKLTIKKDGYRMWERNITLNEGGVARYVYPFLLPESPQAQNLKTYNSQPPLLTQSPDRRWLLVQASGDDDLVFDEYNTSEPTKAPRTITLPASLLTNRTQTGSKLEEIEWSSDNNHLLLSHTYQGGKEYIIFNRERPSESININRVFSIQPTEVALHNKKIDQLYIFNLKTGNLQRLNTANATAVTLLKNVLAFKPNGDNLITYVTNQDAQAGQVAIRIWDGDNSYLLYTLSASSAYLIDMAQFQGAWYYVAGNNGDERINIYKNPLNGLKNPTIARATPMLSLNIKGASKVSFSTNTRFIAAQAEQSFAVYDFEGQSAYQYAFQGPLATTLRWMDGHRLIGTTDGRIFITDYDATNQQTLLPTSLSTGGYFDRGYKYLFTTVSLTDNVKGTSLQLIDMRAGADLPRQ